jgi:DNA-binding response OmpR family regulator
LEHLLVVAGEVDLLRHLVACLQEEGYSVEPAGDGMAALFAQVRRRADLIILERKLPALDGFKVLARLRGLGDPVPVLLLTRAGVEAERLKGLELGADDCLAQPFSIPELCARVKVILRRARGPRSGGVLTTGPFRFDFAAMTATRDGVELGLTSRELSLLAVLATSPGRTITRAELLDKAWAQDARPTPRTVDVHVAKLRKKLGDCPEHPFLATVLGEGYRWTAD